MRKHGGSFSVITEIYQPVSEKVISGCGVLYQELYLISCLFAELGDDLFRLIYGGFVNAHRTDTFIARKYCGLGPLNEK